MTPAAADRVMARLAALWPAWKPTREQFDIWHREIAARHEVDMDATLAEMYAESKWREPVLADFRRIVANVRNERAREESYRRSIQHKET